jgi:hypothetical protein
MAERQQAVRWANAWTHARGAFVLKEHVIRSLNVQRSKKEARAGRAIHHVGENARETFTV